MQFTWLNAVSSIYSSWLIQACNHVIAWLYWRPCWNSNIHCRDSGRLTFFPPCLDCSCLRDTQTVGNAHFVIVGGILQSREHLALDFLINQRAQLSTSRFVLSIRHRWPFFFFSLFYPFDAAGWGCPFCPPLSKYDVEGRTYVYICSEQRGGLHRTDKSSRGERKTPHCV